MDNSQNNIEKQSRTAIKQYIDQKIEHNDRHKATVLISIGKTQYNCCDLYVKVQALPNSSYVVIETDISLTTNTFTVPKDSFRIIAKTLLIDSIDTLGQKVHIEITDNSH